MAKRRKQIRSKERGRKARSYNRRYGTREPRLVILIVCEGKKTEPNYIHALRKELKISTIELEVKPDSGAPISVVNRAIELREKRQQESKGRTASSQNYDEVWCVMDVENPHHNPTFQTAVNKANEYGINLAISNPTYEYWYLIHYQYTNKPFQNADEVINELSEHIPNYDKDMDVFSLVFDKTETAIKNATTCLNNHLDGTPYPNSSTTVHILVDKLIKMVHYRFQ